MSFSDKEGWTVALSNEEGDFESEAVSVRAGEAVTVPVDPKNRTVIITRYVLRYGELAWRDGKLPGREEFRAEGGTYTLWIPADAFRLALGTWVGTGVLPTALGLDLDLDLDRDPT